MPDEASSRSTIISFGLIIIAIIGGAAVLRLSRPEAVQITINPPPPTVTPGPTVTPHPIQIYVTGAVANPEQIYTLPGGSRVQDALTAAGGIVPNANMTRVNPVQFLRDGDHVHVPFADETLSAPTPGDVVRINSAGIDELITLPGIGPVIAERIIDYRIRNGPFFALEDLLHVDGIGPRTLESFAGLIVFD